MISASVREEEARHIDSLHGLPADVPVYLYVGRMMWYKNIRIILDALKKLRDDGRDFRMIMVGKGSDEGAIDRYIARLGLKDRIIRTGKIGDRELLRAYYSRADLFLFPSVFDTHGIVVREAAACGCPSLLVRGSSSACGIIEAEEGFTAEENPEAFARRIAELTDHPEWLKKAGSCAMDRLYLSWEDAVSTAYKRFENLCANCKYPLPCHAQMKSPSHSITVTP